MAGIDWHGFYARHAKVPAEEITCNPGAAGTSSYYLQHLQGLLSAGSDADRLGEISVEVPEQDCLLGWPSICRYY